MATAFDDYLKACANCQAGRAYQERGDFEVLKTAIEHGALSYDEVLPRIIPNTSTVEFPDKSRIWFRDGMDFVIPHGYTVQKTLEIIKP